MPPLRTRLLSDIRTGRRLVRNILNSRRNRAAVARQSPSHPLPAPGSIQIAVYFADTRVNLYQLRQWYAPLAELASTWPVAIISRAPSTVLSLWDEAPVPTYYVRSVADLEHFVHDQDIRIVFYVNQNAKNFQMFRYGRMWHVFINHGESDKMYMTTNQFKAYDYGFVAGDAAIERLSHKLWDFDLKKRALKIGRPQADHFTGVLPYVPDSRTVVLYAPTWEGDRAAAAYGSIATHGVADPAYLAANETIIAAIAKANAADPTAQHVFDTSYDLGWQLSAPDVAITDISAMVYDRLATGKPLLIARPLSDEAEVDESGYLGACEWLRASEASDIVAIANRVQFDEEARARLQFWVERHFGDTTQGNATKRFRAAITKLMREWEKHSAIHAGDALGSEGDPFDDDDEDSAPGE